MTLASGVALGSEPHPLVRYRAEFPIFRDRINLNTCSLGALGDRARRKVVEFLDLWQTRGAAAWYDVWWAALAELRSPYAGVVATGPSQIALAPSVSAAGRHLAAQGIVADARPGHVRLSPLFYNVQDDHVAALEQLTAHRGH
jgi:kynureninase